MDQCMDNRHAMTDVLTSPHPLGVTAVMAHHHRPTEGRVAFYRMGTPLLLAPCSMSHVLG